MSSQEAGLDLTDHGTEGGWEATAHGSAPLDGVRTAGFRDTAAVGLDLRVIPQPVVVVVIGLGGEQFAIETPAGSMALSSFVAAPAPGPIRVLGDQVECVEMRLSPRSAYGLLGVSTREFDGSPVSLDEVWGRPGQLLREQLADTPTWQQRLALTDEFLIRRADRAPAVTPEVAAAWQHIVTRRGRVRIGELAASCGWSRKRLWSRFSEQIGLTPKKAAMLVRFDHAARALRAGMNPIEVATACGYVDQPHLHRDMLAFAGCTPGVMARGQSPDDARPPSGAAATGM
ncbi:helix-turn-helix domain-containing protein [Streptomyces triticagri]|uniref:Helix-turn-helix domain-containing protein n=1 Tax=Streptomyces triticagri TaxID=2293568 RepID=A0A372M2B2_9ACTN|nr:AraC family transcriptional regulator [Streptomyces triticagri]RFU84750.1 helix-turn-helix domain-containing protein [Streptomyces triticagri]